MVSNGNTSVLARVVYLGLKWGFPGLVRDIRGSRGDIRG